VAARFTPKQLMNTRVVALAAIARTCQAVDLISEDFMNDREIALTAVTCHSRMLQRIPAKFRDDREIVLIAVDWCGRDLQYASNSLKNEREIVLATVRETGGALVYATSELKSDREIVLAAVNADSRLFSYGGKNEVLYRRHYRPVYGDGALGYDNDEWALEHAPLKYKKDPEMVGIYARAYDTYHLRAWEEKVDRQTRCVIKRFRVTVLVCIFMLRLHKLREERIQKTLDADWTLALEHPAINGNTAFMAVYHLAWEHGRKRVRLA